MFSYIVCGKRIRWLPCRQVVEIVPPPEPVQNIDAIRQPAVRTQRTAAQSLSFRCFGGNSSMLGLSILLLKVRAIHFPQLEHDKCRSILMSKGTFGHPHFCRGLGCKFASKERGCREGTDHDRERPDLVRLKSESVTGKS